MWKIGVTLSLVALFSLPSVSLAATTLDNSQPAVTLTYSEYQTLNDNLTTLANNSTLQQQRIEKLNQLLQTASLSTNESQTALIKAQNQTQEQEKQLQKLNQLLETQTQQLTRTQASLQTANASLTQLEAELKREQLAEKRNKVWAIVATGVAVYLISK